MLFVENLLLSELLVCSLICFIAHILFFYSYDDVRSYKAKKTAHIIGIFIQMTCAVQNFCQMISFRGLTRRNQPQALT